MALPEHCCLTAPSDKSLILWYRLSPGRTNQFVTCLNEENNNAQHKRAFYTHDKSLPQPRSGHVNRNKDKNKYLLEYITVSFVRRCLQLFIYKTVLLVNQLLMKGLFFNRPVSILTTSQAVLILF